MYIGSTTVFKNDKFFLGDVVITTEDFENGYIGVTVVTIPENIRAGMVWVLHIAKGDLSDNEQVLEEIKKDEYECYGASETIEIIEEETK